MMKKIKRTFDKEFKLEVVKRSLDNVSVKELSKELDIHVGVISRWRKEFLESGEVLSFPGKGKESLSPEEVENRRLTKALREKELELEILKKAISIFSKKDRTSTDL